MILAVLNVMILAVLVVLTFKVRIIVMTCVVRLFVMTLQVRISVVTLLMRLFVMTSLVRLSVMTSLVRLLFMMITSKFMLLIRQITVMVLVAGLGVMAIILMSIEMVRVLVYNLFMLLVMNWMVCVTVFEMFSFKTNLSLFVFPKFVSASILLIFLSI